MDSLDTKPAKKNLRIKLMGIGGGGCNTVDYMIDNHVSGIEFMAANTDHEALQDRKATIKIPLGLKSTESKGQIISAIKDADILFLVAGFGGATGSGASSVIAELAKEMGIFTIAIGTEPFSFEGKKRRQAADDGINSLNDRVDSLILVANDKLLEITGGDTTIKEAFDMVNSTLSNSIQGLTNQILCSAESSLDFEDIKALLKDSGMARLGFGEASGNDNLVHAAEIAINSPLLTTDVARAKTIIVSITGDEDTKISDVYPAVEIVKQKVHKDAQILFGLTRDKTFKNKVSVSLILSTASEA